MKWTKTPPGQGGWYWHRFSPRDPHPTVEWLDEFNGVLHLWADSVDDYKELATVAGEWAGPLTPPE